MIRVAVVILNWNGIHHLKTYFPSVHDYTPNPGDRVYVVDNGSTDGSVEWVRETYPDTEIMVFPENLGFALGYAKALQQIKALYFVLLNSDVEVTPGWLDPLVETMEADPETGACMPKLLSSRERDRFEYAGAAGGFIDRYGYPFCRGRMLDHVETDHGQYDSVREIFWASGACMFVRSDAYFRAGGLDGDFFAHMEEIDLCWRIKRNGYRILIVPQAQVYHLGGGTLPNNNPQKIYLNYRNNLYLLFKNLPSSRLLSVMGMRMALDGMSALVYLLSGSFRFFWAVFRAHVDFYRHLPRLIGKRKDRNGRTIPTKVGEIYPRSILVDFFIRKKREFGQLAW